MSTTIDQRVASLKFDNAQFESGVKTSLLSLSKLKDSLNFEGSAKSLSSVSKGFSKFDTSAVSNGLNELQLKFSAFDIAVATVISNLVTSFTNKLGGAIKNTIGLISSGGMRRAQNLEQARFSMQGLLVSTKDVNGELQEFLNYGISVDDVMKAGGPVQNAVSGTAYGLDEAAKAASNFIASGITDLDDLEYALKSISGSAAQTGDSYENMARIYGKVAGQGRVMGDDLNSMASRGVNAASTISKYLETQRELLGSYEAISPALGKAIAGMDDFDATVGLTEGNVRSLVSSGLINFDIFSHAMYEAFGENAFRANDTFSGSLSNMKAALSRFGAKFATPYLENMRDIFNALRPMIDTISEALDPIVNKINELFKSLTQFAIGKINGINEFFSKFNVSTKTFLKTSISTKEGIDGVSQSMRKLDRLKELTPFDKLATSLSNFVNSALNIGGAIKNIFSPIGKLFDSLKPSTSAVDTILNFSSSLSKTTTKIKEFTSSSEGIKDFLSSFLDIGKFTKIFSTLGKTLSNFGKGFKNIFGSVFNTFSAFKPNANIKRFFDSLANVLQIVSNKLLSISIKFKNFTEGVKKQGNVISPLTKIFEVFNSVLSIVINTISNFFDKLTNLETVGNTISIIFDKIGSVLKFVGSIISSVFSEIKESFTGFNIGNAAGIVALFGGGGIIYQMVGILSKLKGQVSSGFGLSTLFDSISSALNNFTSMFQGVPADLTEKARNLAVSIAILAGALAVLSLIEPNKLLTSIGAITIVFGELIGAVKLLGTLQINTKQIRKITKSLTALSVSVLVLSVAMKLLASIDTNEIIQGTMAIAALVGTMALFSKSVDGLNGKNLQKTTKSLVSLAIAIDLLVIAVKQLGGMDTNQLIQGLVAVGVVLGGLALFSKFNDADGVSLSSGAGILLLSTALLIISKAVQSFGAMDYDTMYNGLMGVALSLATIALFSRAVKDSGVLSSSAALLITAAALNLLVIPLKTLGSIEPTALTQGLVSMAAAMAIVVAVFNLMPKDSILTAGALIVASTGIIVLAGALKILSTIPLEGMLIAIGGLAASLLVLGVAASLLSPIIPAILGLSAAMTLFGVGVLTLATGIAILTPVLLAFTVALAGSLEILLTSLINSGSLILNALTSVLKAIIGAIRNVIVDIAKTVVELIKEILNAINTNMPSLLSAVGGIITKLIRFLVKKIPELAAAGIQLVIGLLKAIRKKIKEIVELGIDIIVNLIKGITKGLPKLLNAGFDLIISFINGLAKTIRKKSEILGKAAGNLVTALIEGMVKFLKGLVSEPVKAIGDLAEKVISKLGEIISFKKIKELISSAIEGVIDGITGFIEKAKNAIKDLAEGIIGKFKSLFGINSPSTVFKGFGDNILTGLINGMDGKAADGIKKIGEVAGNIFEKAKEVLSLDNLKEVGSSAIDGIRNGFTAAFPNLSEKATNIITDVRERFNKNFNKDKTEPNGKAVIAGLRTGINQAAPDLSKLVSTVGLTTATKLTSDITKDKMNTSGANAVAGLRNGMYSNRSNIYATAADIGSGTKSSITNIINEEEFKGVGVQLVNGLKSGIKKQAPQAYEQARSLARGAINAVKWEFDVKSPSRVFYSIGSYCVQGLGNAFKDDTSTIRTVTDFSRTIIDSVNESMDGLENIDPVITPVLDLDNIQNGSRQISSLLNTNPSISSRLSSISSNGKTDPVLDAMNQLTNMLNGISDRELSPEDIYEAIKTGAENASFTILLDGKQLTNRVNEINTSIMDTRLSYL